MTNEQSSDRPMTAESVAKGIASAMAEPIYKVYGEFITSYDAVLMAIKQQRQQAAEAMKQKCLAELEKCNKFYVYMKEPDGSDTLSIRLQQAQEAVEAIPTGDC